MTTPTIRILDGGMSRELTRLGAQLRQPEWSAGALIETPDIVGRVHDDFIAAGADLITTNSYALVPFHIGHDRFRTQGADLIQLSGRLARQAADAVAKQRQVQVAGSLPPIFGSYQPARFDAARVHDYLSVLVRHLTPYVDVWLGETLSLIAEAEAVRDAVRDTAQPVWISFTLDDAEAAQEPRLRSGETVTAAAEWASEAGIAALLFNCSRPEVMEAAVRAAAAVLDRRPDKRIAIGVYGNAFDGDQDGDANETLHEIRRDMDAARYCDFAAAWIRAGASIVGGCCGIGARHIAALTALKTSPVLDSVSSGATHSSC